MNVAVNVAGEVEELVTVEGDVITGNPSYWIVMVEPGANPDPDTVTIVPGVPAAGLRMIPTETPKEAEARTIEPKRMFT